MPSAEFEQSRSDSDDGQSAIQCDACESAFGSDSRQAVAFLLLDQLTIPVISCDDHLEQFASVCGLTTEDTTELLHHRPAGGIRCPGCRLAPYNSVRSMIPVHDGAIGVVACPAHQAEIVQRFHTGLETHQYLSSSISTNTSSSL